MPDTKCGTKVAIGTGVAQWFTNCLALFDTYRPLAVQHFMVRDAFS
jgi:hypothetical protein